MATFFDSHTIKTFVLKNGFYKTGHYKPVL